MYLLSDVIYLILITYLRLSLEYILDYMISEVSSMLQL